jgi:hypothetical protein
MTGASRALDGTRHPGKDRIRSLRIISRAGENRVVLCAPDANDREGLRVILVQIDEMAAESVR